MAARDTSFNSDRQVVGGNLAVTVEMTSQEYDAAVKSLIPHILAYFVDDCTFFVGTPFGPDVVATVNVARLDKNKKLRGPTIKIRTHGSHEIEWDDDREYNKWRYFSYRTIFERLSENGTKKPLSDSNKVIAGLIEKIKNPGKTKDIGKTVKLGNAIVDTGGVVLTRLGGGIIIRPYNTPKIGDSSTILQATEADRIPTPPLIDPPASQQMPSMLTEIDEVCAFVDGYENTDGISPTGFVDGSWPGYVVFSTQTPELENRWINLDTDSEDVNLVEITTFLNDVIRDWPFLPEGETDLQWTFAFWDRDGEDRELIGVAESSNKKIQFYWSAHEDCIYVKPSNTGRVSL
jgi:hypothetical protein